MANAKKCDRCGSLFDPFTKRVMCRFKNPEFKTKDDMCGQRIGKLMFSDSGPESWIDLCPECSEMFETFMCGGEPETDISSDPNYVPKATYMTVLRDYCNLADENTQCLCELLVWKGHYEKQKKEYDDVIDRLTRMLGFAGKERLLHWIELDRGSGNEESPAELIDRLVNEMADEVSGKANSDISEEGNNG